MTALRRDVLDAVVALQAHVRARKATRVVQHVREVAAAVLVAAAARRYLALTTNVVGKLLSKTRRQAKALAAKDRELAKTKVTLRSEVNDYRMQVKDKDIELAKAKELIATREKELETAVHATLCDEKLEVEVHGSVIHLREDEKQKGSHRKYHRGIITKILANGRYEIDFDHLDYVRRSYPATAVRIV